MSKEESFEIPSLNVIQSSLGFSVEILRRFSLLYKDGSRSLEVEMEFLSGPAGICIYKRSIHNWDPPNNEKQITDTERERIVDNIHRAFLFRGYDIGII